MKKIRIALTAVAVTALSGTTAFAVEDWEKIYSDVIYNESLSITYSDPDEDPYSLEYGLFDIDGDNVPELFVGSWQYKDVYTIKNNTAEKIWKTHDFRVLRMLPNENAILDGGGPLFDATALHWVSKFHMSNGRIMPPKDEIVRGDIYNAVVVKPEKVEISVDYGDGWEEHFVYKVKNKIVSAKEYKDAYEKILSSGIELKTYDIGHKGWQVNDLKSKVTKRIVNKQATASNQKIAVNENSAIAESYLIDGNNYCKLRDIAYILKDTDACFQVGWLNTEKAISITTGQRYTGAGGKTAAGRKSAVSSSADIYIDGEYVQMEGYTIDGSNYFKLRDIAELLGIKAEWNNGTKTINIVTAIVSATPAIRLR